MPRMRPACLIFALIALMAVACGLPTGDTVTPRPTYTPYPTFTPETSSTTGSSTENRGQESAQGEYVEIGGRRDWFFGKAKVYVEKGDEQFWKGNYREAIEHFKQAQEHRGSPSAVLENRIGNSYQALELYQDAVRHHSSAIEIEDSSVDRVARGTAYLYQGLCEPAVADAKVALTMEPQSADGRHTDAEANYILGSCYAYDGQYLLALQHAEAALEISRDNNYENQYLSDGKLLVAQISDGLDPNKPHFDFFLIPASEKWEQGIKNFDAGDFQRAIENFETAQQYHGKPSTVIESWLGLSFQSLERHDQAILRFTRAIEIKDSSVDRVNRSLSYMSTTRCPEAINDAQEALSLPSHLEPGYHSEVEANSVLAGCYSDAGNYRLANVHAEAALGGAISHDYSADDIALLLDFRDYIRSLDDAQN